MVEHFFRVLTVKPSDGVFHSVAELRKAIRDYIDEDNRNPRPYLWTAKARDIKAGSSPPRKASTAGWY